MKQILNLTQHQATPEQIGAGVFEPSEKDKKEIQKLLTFDEIPVEMASRAYLLKEIVKTYGVHNVMIGGAPYFMSTLERYLKNEHITPMYAFSSRESVEVHTPNGVEKKSVFKHLGFVKL